MTKANHNTSEVAPAFAMLQEWLDAGYGPGSATTHIRELVLRWFGEATADPRFDPGYEFEPGKNYTKMKSRGIDLAVQNLLTFLRNPTNGLTMKRDLGSGSTPNPGYELPPSAEDAAKNMIVESVDRIISYVEDGEDHFDNVWGIDKASYEQSWDGVEDAEPTQGRPVMQILPTLSEEDRVFTVDVGEWRNDPQGYVFRWYLDNSVILGAMGAVYTAGLEVAGELTVSVVAVNYMGESDPVILGPETLTSPLPVNTAAPTISLDSERLYQVDDPGTWTESPDSYRYQWNLNGMPVEGATGTTFDVPPELGGDLTVTVWASNEYGESFTGAESGIESVEGGSGNGNPNQPGDGPDQGNGDGGDSPVPEGAPVALSPPYISELSYPLYEVYPKPEWEGNPTSFRHQWYVNGEPVEGAIFEYFEEPSDAGDYGQERFTITVRIWASNSIGESAYVESGPVEHYTMVEWNLQTPPEYVGNPPVIIPTMGDSYATVVHSGDWSGPPSAYSYKWYQGENVLGSSTTLQSVAGLDPGDGPVWVEVTTSIGGGSPSVTVKSNELTLPLTSAPINPLLPDVDYEADPFLPLIAIDESDENGRTYLITPERSGKWTGEPSSFRYQWKNRGTPLVGEIGNTFVMPDEESGQISVEVYAINEYGESEFSQESATWGVYDKQTATEVYEPFPTGHPPIAVFDELESLVSVVDHGGWDAPPIQSYRYQWCLDNSPISGETGDSISLTGQETGYLTVRIWATNLVGETESGDYGESIAIELGQGSSPG